MDCVISRLSLGTKNQDIEVWETSNLLIPLHPWMKKKQRGREYTYKTNLPAKGKNQISEGEGRERERLTWASDPTHRRVNMKKEDHHIPTFQDLLLLYSIFQSLQPTWTFTHSNTYHTLHHDSLLCSLSSLFLLPYFFLFFFLISSVFLSSSYLLPSSFLLLSSFFFLRSSVFLSFFCAASTAAAFLSFF